MGGEKFTTKWRTCAFVGSPPRGRGKERHETPVLCGGGITPAWAGKRTVGSTAGKEHGDHPRVGGEKFRGDTGQKCRQGSPPRGRGKVCDFYRELGVSGITPAWAGKSDTLLSGGKVSQDHPRVGGEKRFLYLRRTSTEGSPPRGRGKAPSKFRVGAFPWITPAWAGKSCIGLAARPAPWDHPRVGGEKTLNTVSMKPPKGSPPRGRGKD